MKTCSIEGCDGRHAAKGYCQHHYDGLRRYGDPLAIKATAPNGAHQKWIDAALVSDSAECVVWPFGVNANGYGHTRFRGIQTGPHRIVCILAHGEPSASWLQAAHRCGNPACCNPNHLRWATPGENCEDKRHHGTLSVGSSLPQATLTEAQVLAIIAQLPLKRTSELAAEFGVTRATISGIAAGRNWSWLTGRTRGGDQNRAA
jgi:hypothetical protein